MLRTFRQLRRPGGCVSLVTRSGVRRGVTMTEVLVVIGIIALLIGILLPAVQYARESARMSDCRNRIRQIATAMSLHETQQGTYPRSVFRDSMLPFLEQVADVKQVALFACPSDSGNANGDFTVGRVSYAINAGLGSGDMAHAGVAPSNRGRLRSRDVLDGLSNTAMVGERLSFPSYAPQGVAWNEVPQDWKRTYQFYIRKPASIADFAVVCSQEIVRPLGTWYITDKYHHLLPPNSVSCVLTTESGAIGTGPYSSAGAAGSVHSGGTHVAYCDGSVHFFSSHTDITVWRAIGTIQGGETF
ncbi:MAG: DUF1559 domain-containing protein [Planctomycetaceae bacterium]|nr:DUF1559 domain-containing protein [Planctomycetaceae bacterium]